MIGIDHEYISEHAPEGDTPGVRPNVETDYCEIMQLGACKLNALGSEVAVLNLTVRAHKIHTIPRWLTRLTGMTEEKRARGVSFPEALAQFVAFVGQDDEIWTMGGDWWVMFRNAEAHGITLPFKPFNRLSPYLPRHGITLEKFKAVGLNEVTSGGLYRVLGIRLPEIIGVGEHNAAHDARSLAHSVRRLKLA